MVKSFEKTSAIMNSMYTALISARWTNQDVYETRLLASLSSKSGFSLDCEDFPAQPCSVYHQAITGAHIPTTP
jgi:hypothetical protein